VADEKFRFYLAGVKEEAEVSFFDFHKGERGSVTFDSNGEYATNNEGIGEALEMLAVGHPLIRSGTRPKKGASNA
jgi:hypothetical protein